MLLASFWEKKTHREVDPGDTRSSPFATICSKCAPYLGVENDTHGQLSINCTLKKTKVVTLLYEKCAALSETSVSVMSEWHTKGMANSHTSVAHAFRSSRQCNLWRSDKHGRFSDLVVKRKLGHVRPLVCSGKAGSSGSACPTFYRLVWDMLGYVGICWDMLGYVGICWDMLGSESKNWFRWPCPHRCCYLRFRSNWDGGCLSFQIM